MSVVITGDTQSTALAGYVASVSGRPVHLDRPDSPIVREVVLDGEIRSVAISSGEQLPGGPLEALIVIAQSRDLRAHLERWADRLDGVPILLAPGGFAGALRARAWFAQWGLPEPLVAEVTGFPVSGSIEGERLTLRGVKRGLPIAGISNDQTEQAFALFSGLMPHLAPSHLTTTSLSNTNHMIHPGVMVVNAARVDNGESFSFYRGGISPAVDRLLSVTDRERIAVVRAIGGEAVSVTDWMTRFYGAEGMRGRGIVECLASYEPFAGVLGPTQLDHRYLADDVPFGLAQWSSLARQVEVPTPHLDALLTMAQVLVPDLPLAADEESARLFVDFLASGPAGVS